MSDEGLAHAVAAELAADPEVDGRAIAVSAYHDVVTLRGTVGGVRELRAAIRAAERVAGLGRVDDRLDVRRLDDERSADADLRAAVLQALMADAAVPATVDAKVRHGVVTLVGTARRRYQRDAAGIVAASVPGVVAVDNDIDLTAPQP